MLHFFIHIYIKQFKIGKAAIVLFFLFMHRKYILQFNNMQYSKIGENY